MTGREMLTEGHTQRKKHKQRETQTQGGRYESQRGRHRHTCGSTHTHVEAYTWGKTHTNGYIHTEMRRGR